MTAIIIGNGSSRKDLKLSELKGKTYGCNSIINEFIPDVLVATDDPISKHIQKSGYAKRFTFYTRKVYAGTGALQLRPQYKNWCSGSNALQLAVYDDHKEIYILGFDFGSNIDEINNVYAGAEFYKHRFERSSYYGDWVSQISTIIKKATKVRFTFVTNSYTTESINDLVKNKNVAIISTEKYINNFMEKAK